VSGRSIILPDGTFNNRFCQEINIAYSYIRNIDLARKKKGKSEKKEHSKFKYILEYMQLSIPAADYVR
jgi:hypothetical protein